MVYKHHQIVYFEFVIVKVVAFVGPELEIVGLVPVEHAIEVKIEMLVQLEE